MNLIKFGDKGLEVFHCDDLAGEPGDIVIEMGGNSHILPKSEVVSLAIILVAHLGTDYNEDDEDDMEDVS